MRNLLTVAEGSPTRISIPQRDKYIGRFITDKHVKIDHHQALYEDPDSLAKTSGLFVFLFNQNASG